MRNFETDRERAASDLAERLFSSWRSKATAIRYAARSVIMRGQTI